MARGSMMDDMPPVGGDAAPVGAEPDGDETDDGLEDSAFADLAEALSIPEEKREAARAALEDFVSGCMTKG